MLGPATPRISHTWACSCGAETACEAEDLTPGSIWQCIQCWNAFACVRSDQGPTVWVGIKDDDVKFHRLFGD